MEGENWNCNLMSKLNMIQDVHLSVIRLLEFKVIRKQSFLPMQTLSLLVYT